MSQSHDESCFTNFALQEHTLGRLSAEVRLGLEGHVEECAECAACLRLIEKETRLLCEALQSNVDNSRVEALDTETLAMYLDDSLDRQMREKCEQLLASSPGDLRALISLRRESVSVTNAENSLLEKPLRPAGRIIRMPKRQFAPRNITELSGSESEAAEE